MYGWTYYHKIAEYQREKKEILGVFTQKGQITLKNHI